MKFRKEIRFPGDLQDVVAMLADHGFRTAVATQANPGHHHIAITRHGDGFTAVLETETSTAGLPGAAQKVLGSSYRIRQEEDWSSPSQGTMHVTIPGKPGSVRGTISLHQDQAVVVQTVDADIKVAIPFVGSKVEQVIGRVLGHVLKLQESVGATWANR